MTPRQLTFTLNIEERCDFASFHTGGNSEVLARLRGVAAGDLEVAGIWLWGGAGAGCSHLLKALCQAVSCADKRAVYLPLAALPREPDVIEDLSGSVVAVDDVKCWLGDRELETALMGLYQRQLELGGSVVVADRVPASRLDFSVADLASRFRSLASYEVAPLDDAGLKAVLRQSALRRGLELPEPVADFWLARSRRVLPVLLAELEQLDCAALAEGRRLTIPLLKSVLGL